MSHPAIFRIYKQKGNNFEPQLKGKTSFSNIDERFGTPLLNSWEIPNLDWYKEDGGLPKDIHFLLSTYPLCSQKAYECLLTLNNLTDVEFLPLNIENERFYLINVCKSMTNILNRSKSDIDYYPDKRIMFVSKFVFYPTDFDSCIFRIPESATAIFVTEAVVDIVKKNRLTGLIFESIPSVKKSLWENLRGK